MFQDFKYSFLVTFLCVGVAIWWGATTSMGIATAIFLVLVLGIMEVSLSFDNAVVNASVLKEMDEYWQKMFLTVGILIAVFGMRLVFPIVIVAIATGLGTFDVMQMALNNPQEYSRHLMESHAGIAAFGGMFLLLVFLSFMFDNEKEVHWLEVIEHKMSELGKLDVISILIALATLFALQALLPIDDATRLTILIAGLGGVVLYIAVSSLDVFFEDKEEGDAAVKVVTRNGLAGFLYLEVLDASFSFDGVIGAFAITKDVVIIMLGLAIGAMFVRSLTVHLVHKGTLDEYIYLEHGAHYGIGALAVIMLFSIHYHIPEVITGLIGVTFIVLSIVSSLRYKKKQLAEA
ncbi:DUF475 domain-containing protein [Thiothrix lacustris]|uniref:DUF475 domain-containing protein n=1 Tax=Thiothrix lacustris TaxID=525917 RepID=A0ABY9MP59_9GAMM|nr:DUF475 domain-containing protein [Thiothrix lacustris]WML90333.1 DUF475 domain-containing protein [Thiothrix lacustris]WMP18024.1 DUF475 domain-containing protein [Thiothrix lacustris]